MLRLHKNIFRQDRDQCRPAGNVVDHCRARNLAPWVIDRAVAVHTYLGLCEPDDNRLNSFFGLSPLELLNFVFQQLYLVNALGKPRLVVGQTFFNCDGLVKRLNVAVQGATKY